MGSFRQTTTISPSNTHPNPPPHLVTEAPEQPIATATMEMVRSEKPGPKSTTAPKRTAWKPKNADASFKTATPKNHTSKPFGPHPKVHLPTRGSLISLRPPSSPSMCGADSSTPVVHLLPPHRTSTAASPEYRYQFRGGKWQYALGGLNCLKPCAFPAGMRKECAAGSLNWSIFSASTESKFVS